MKLPKTETAEHERPGTSPWPAVLHLAAGILLGWLPLLFARGTELYFTDAPGVWIYSLGFVVVATSLGMSTGLVAVRKLGIAGLRWLQTLLLLGAFATLPLLPDRNQIAMAAADAGLALLKLLCLKAGLVSLAMGVFLGVRFARREGDEAGPDIPLMIGVLVGQLGFLMILASNLTIRSMDFMFSWCVLVFALVAILVVWRDPHPARIPDKKNSGRAEKEKPARRLEAWLVGVVIMLLLVVSNRAMNNLVSDPKLWVLPVLITVIAFATGWFRAALQRPLVIAGLQVVGVLALTMTLYVGSQWSPGTLLEVLYLGLAASVLASSATAGRLAGSEANKSPGVQPFVVVIIATVLVTYGAQRLARSEIEFPITILLASLLVLIGLKRFGAGKPFAIAGNIGFVLLLVAVGVNLYLRRVRVIESVRTFYGVTQAMGMGTGGHAYRMMLTGDTPRGIQTLAADTRFEPTLVHGRNTGIGLLFRSFPKGNFRRVGVVGVGNGDLLGYADPKDSFRFYEFDPGAVTVANDEFTYLPEARRADFDWKLVTGPPRFTLGQEPPGQFDILILDVFGAGPLPSHLLTKEAFDVWRKQLAADGVLAINITNNRFNLMPVVWRQAIESGLTMIPVFTKADPKTGATGADWVFLTNNSELLRNKAFLKPKPADITQARQFPLWTDETCQPLSVLR